eukprot:1322950-Prymnesium_polylepis.1
MATRRAGVRVRVDGRWVGRVRWAGRRGSGKVLWRAAHPAVATRRRRRRPVVPQPRLRLRGHPLPHSLRRRALVVRGAVAAVAASGRRHERA